MRAIRERRLLGGGTVQERRAPSSPCEGEDAAPADDRRCECRARASLQSVACRSHVRSQRTGYSAFGPGER